MADFDPRIRVNFWESGIKNGMIPSAFFPFPGLISDQAIFDKVIQYRLSPTGSDAWPAKNQIPQSGSIVLIHSNGNEPVGIKKFLGFLKSKKTLLILGTGCCLI